ncbi:CMRF35-like molecule 8 [Toxotes jaculatrix]|uniref:CMRF35-like molecule 8 n=1 Tax=Toxotes jaculatrix TaxID=941984 RepID=UPI001B3AD89D|nr:CMRF35-like molecule 8 [Toxotes jaculatrix]
MTMKISLKVIICLMTASVRLLSVAGKQPVNMNCDNAPVTQRAEGCVGDSVTINCTYPRADKIQVKYFCKENCKDENSTCTNVISTYASSHTKQERFSITDHKEHGVYTVVISMLTWDDAGRYWCAVKSVDDNSITHLSVIQLSVCNWDDIKLTANKYTAGDSVQMMCPYLASHENNTKYLCKGENPFDCLELIHTTEGERQRSKDRFLIRDNQRKKYFYVQISNLRTADSGLYWCGSGKKSDPAAYTKIQLTVDQGHMNTRKEETTIPPPPAVPGAIGGVLACLALIVIVVLILCRHKLFRTKVCCASGGSSGESTNIGQNTEGNHGDHDYEEIQVRNQEANSGGAVASVYAIANPPPDQLHYASFNFLKDSVTVSTDSRAQPDTDHNDSSACDYSSISRTPVLYQTVTKPK